MVEPHSLNFRVITANFLGVRIFRKFTVHVTKNSYRNLIGLPCVPVIKENKRF